MKKRGFFLILACFLTSFAWAQKFGYIDSKYILDQMPEYQQARTEIDQLSQGWQQEIEQMNAEVAKLEEAYRAEEVLLTEEMKTERQEEINAERAKVRAYQKKVFGFDGLLFLKRQELIKPVQDLIFEAVETVCQQKRVQFMFDKSAGLVMIYTSPRHDYTDYVLEELGLGDPDDVIDNPR